MSSLKLALRVSALLAVILACLLQGATVVMANESVVLRVVDQNGQEIPGSLFRIAHEDIATGTAVPLEVGTHTLRLAPGAFGHSGVSALARTETVEVTAGMTELVFEWITSDVTLRLQDQFGVDIPGSYLYLTQYANVENGTVATLPITDESVYPTMGGSQMDGYFIHLITGILKHGNLHREVIEEVGVDTTEITHEWILHPCRLHLRDEADVSVPDSLIALPHGFPAPSPDGVFLFPVNDPEAYPTLDGAYAAGFPIEVMPGDVAPTSATLPFRMLASDAWEPPLFDVGPNTYQLACGAPPVAVATGGGVFELGPASVVTLGGEVADDDGDLLTVEWRWNGTLLFPPDAIQPPAGGDPIALSASTVDTQVLGLGTHALELVVSDGAFETTDAVTVQIIQAEAPTLSPQASESILWPPSHKMHEVMIQANSWDNSGGPVTLSIEVSSDEPVDDGGDGETWPDWEILEVDSETGWIRIDLRAERSGAGDGRTYTVTITATDEAGNASSTSISFVVPHNR